MLAGRDPQLEKAIEVALQALKANPPAEPKHPGYPNRVIPTSMDSH
jgi:tricorn protease